MKRVDLMAELRERRGKGAARSLRREGKIPGVLYSAGRSLLLTLDPTDVSKILHSAVGENALVNLSIQGLKEKKEQTAIFRDFQRDPVTGRILHADLFEVAMDTMIRVKVPVEVTGDVPVGVKADGGVLQHHLREIEIECLPLQIPERITVDASGLRVGESLHVSDLRIETGIRVLEEPGQTVVSVAAPMSEAKLEQLLTSPTGAEVKEPELVGKEKKKEEEGEEPAKGEVKTDEKTKAKKEEPKEEKKESKPKG